MIDRRGDQLGRTRVVVALALLGGVGCGGPSEGEGDAGVGHDAGHDAGIGALDADEPPGLDASAGDASAGDAGPIDAGDPVDAPTPAGDAGPAPTTILQPAPGEVTILQMDLPVGIVPQLGEAAILVGPDGTLVLLDVGNSGHDDDVRDLVVELNTRWITPARGFPRTRGRREVDWIVLSHFHSDHIGAMEDLLTGSEPLDVVGGVVHRGLVDVGPGVTESDYTALCDLLTGTHAHLDVRLCAGAGPGRCGVDAASTNPATSCEGLFGGDLSDPADDVAREPGHLDLGGGARLVFLGADGFVSDGTSARALAFGSTDSNEENARSLVTLVSHGRFRYHWGGDLTGSGEPTEPDVESHVVRTAGDAFYGPLGMDVVHAHHHVRATSSNTTFVEATAPADGRSRNVVGGVNPAYVLSPYPEVLARWADGARLGIGAIWLTDTATGGGSHASLVVSGAAVIVQTSGGGAGYWVQAASDAPITRGFSTVR